MFGQTLISLSARHVRYKPFKKKAISKTSLRTKTPFRWVCMSIIPAIYSKSSINDTNFDDDLLILDDYSKMPRLCGMVNITTVEVMDKLDMFQTRFVK